MAALDDILKRLQKTGFVAGGEEQKPILKSAFIDPIPKIGKTLKQGAFDIEGGIATGLDAALDVSNKLIGTGFDPEYFRKDTMKDFTGMQPGKTLYKQQGPLAQTQAEVPDDPIGYNIDYGQNSPIEITPEGKVVPVPGGIPVPDYQPKQFIDYMNMLFSDKEKQQIQGGGAGPEGFTQGEDGRYYAAGKEPGALTIEDYIVGTTMANQMRAQDLGDQKRADRIYEKQLSALPQFMNAETAQKDTAARVKKYDAEVQKLLQETGLQQRAMDGDKEALAFLDRYSGKAAADPNKDLRFIMAEAGKAADSVMKETGNKEEADLARDQYMMRYLPLIGMNPALAEPPQ